MATEKLDGDTGDEGQLTSTPPFEEIKDAIESATPPRRPNRNKAIHYCGWSDELDAWDAASDEALTAFEDPLEE